MVGTCPNKSEHGLRTCLLTMLCTDLLYTVNHHISPKSLIHYMHYTSTSELSNLRLLPSLLLHLRPLPPFPTHSIFNPPKPPQIQPRTHKNDRKIKKDIRPHNPKVSPNIPRENIKTRCKRIARRVLAEATVAIAQRLHVPAGLLCEFARVGFAGEIGRGRENGEFVGVAADGLPCDEQREEAFEEVLEGGEPVHPGAPEGGEAGVGNDDAAEGDDWNTLATAFVNSRSGDLLKVKNNGTSNDASSSFGLNAAIACPKPR